MDHALEFVVLMSVVAIGGVMVLRSGRRSLARQAAVGAAVGLVSAAAVLSGQGDLIPDQLEPVLAALAVSVLLVLVVRTLLRRVADR